MLYLFIVLAFATRTIQQVVSNSSYEVYIPRDYVEPIGADYMAMYSLNNETGTVDSNGNGCDWYDLYAYDESYWPDVNNTGWFYWNCGEFDTPDFKAGQQCAACRGGISYGYMCRSRNGTDANGDNCRG